jgi:hypothetical protein
MNEKENEIDAQKSRIMKLIVQQNSPKPSPLNSLDVVFIYQVLKEAFPFLTRSLSESC